MRCPRCGRAFHKTTRGPNVPYSAEDEALIRSLAARGFYASEIAGRLSGQRTAQNVREKARLLGITLARAPAGRRLNTTA